MSIGVILNDVFSLAGTKEVLCQNWMKGSSATKMPIRDTRRHLNGSSTLRVSHPSKVRPIARQTMARIVVKISQFARARLGQQSSEMGKTKAVVICSTRSTRSADIVSGSATSSRKYRMDKIRFGTIRRRKSPRPAPNCIRHDFIESLDKTSPRSPYVVVESPSRHLLVEPYAG
jgi:hypothetical protein